MFNNIIIIIKLIKYKFIQKELYDEVLIKLLARRVFLGRSSARKKYEHKLYSLVGDFKVTKSRDEFIRLCEIVKSQMIELQYRNTKKIESAKEMLKEIKRLRQ